MLRSIIKSFRLRQWPKNAFVLAALIFDRKLTDPDSAVRSLIGVILFCLVSSSVYIINDIVDIEADRNHPKKRNRPIASGRLSIISAIIVVIFLLLISLPLAYILSTYFGIILTAYFIMQVLYSNWLKHIPLLDVLIIAAGFVFRVASGVTLIQVERFSPWLYVVTTLLALFIGFGKRRSEIITLAEGANSHRRVLEGYNLPLLDQLITIVCSTTIIAYSFYTFSAPNLPDNHSMMLTIPFVLYGIFRYLYLIQVKGEGGAPEELVLSDHPLQFAIALYGAAVLLVFYIF